MHSHLYTYILRLPHPERHDSLILNFHAPILPVSSFQATIVHMKPVEIKGPFPLHFLA